MEKKKRILVAAGTMACGGTEVALLAFLKSIKNKFDVTLLLEQYGGVWVDKIPKDVNVIELKLSNKMMYALIDWRIPFNNKIMRTLFRCYRRFYRLVAKNTKKERYQFLIQHTSKLKDNYDLILDFEGYGYYLTAFLSTYDNIPKAIWVHDEHCPWINDVIEYVEKYDKIFCVSEAVKEKVNANYPQLNNRTEVFHNEINREEIIFKSNQPLQDTNFFGDNLIVSVGRLCRQKGFDLAIDAASILLSKGIKFKWYIIGEGDNRTVLQKQIHLYNLSDYVILLGKKDNPYPYIKAANVYVQTSRHEGYGLAIAEARILKKVVISTDLPCVKEQITDGVNGFLVPFDKEKLASCIEKFFMPSEESITISHNVEISDATFLSDTYKLDLI